MQMPRARARAALRYTIRRALPCQGPRKHGGLLLPLAGGCSEAWVWRGPPGGLPVRRPRSTCRRCAALQAPPPAWRPWRHPLAPSPGAGCRRLPYTRASSFTTAGGWGVTVVCWGIGVGRGSGAGAKRGGAGQSARRHRSRRLRRAARWRPAPRPCSPGRGRRAKASARFPEAGRNIPAIARAQGRGPARRGRRRARGCPHISAGQPAHAHMQPTNQNGTGRKGGGRRGRRSPAARRPQEQGQTQCLASSRTMGRGGGAAGEPPGGARAPARREPQSVEVNGPGVARRKAPRAARRAVGARSAPRAGAARLMGTMVPARAA